MNVLVDTGVWIDYFKGKPHEKVDSALQESRVWITPVIASELISGATIKKDENKLLEFIQTLSCTSADFDHWIRVGQLRQHWIKKGFTISTPDAHILQAAGENKLQLFTQDKIFAKIAAIEKQYQVELL